MHKPMWQILARMLQWTISVFLFAESCGVFAESVPIPNPAWVYTVSASHRDLFESECVRAIARLRTLLLDHDGVANSSERDVLRAYLAHRDVDWPSFLIGIADAHDFPWQAIYNHTYWMLREKLDLRRTWALLSTGEPPPATNVLPSGNVPNSTFFTNTDITSYTPDYLASEVEYIRPRGKITKTRPKKGGTAEGFFGCDERGIEYIFVFDPPFNPEMNTSAEFIGSTLFRILGYRVPKTAICTIHGTGDPRLDGRRAVATIAVQNVRGGWKYRTFKHRREIRAVRLFAAWIHNVDQTDQNTGLSETMPGVYAYYIWDFGASLGSFTFRPKMARLGWTYLWKPEEALLSPLRRAALLPRPWACDEMQYSPAVGCFSDNFDPDRWVPFYPNFAFNEATEADLRWAAARLAQLSEEQVRTVVRLAQFSYPQDADYVLQVLLARRAKLLHRYLHWP